MDGNLRMHDKMLKEALEKSRLLAEISSELRRKARELQESSKQARLLRSKSFKEFQISEDKKVLVSTAA